MKVVVLISATAEWEAAKSLFPGSPVSHTPFGETFNLTLETLPDPLGGAWNLQLLHSGWGKVSSAAMTQYVIDHVSPDLIVNLGTCGGFEGCVNLGDVILAERTFVYDIVEWMAEEDITGYYASTLDLSWLPEPHPYPVRRGTLASADSDLPPDKIPFLKTKGAIAADWESAALAWVAQKNHARLLILRGVSDIVSGHGSDAYHNIEVFNQRAGDIMKLLFDQLPDWLKTISIATSSPRSE